MAVGQTTYSLVSSLIPTIYESALMYLRADNIMSNFVTVFNDRSGLAPRANSEYGAGNWRPLAETDDLSATQFARSALSTLTPAEYGDQFFLTDSRIESDTEQVMADASEELGAGAAKHIETNLLGMFSSLTGGTVGAAGSAISWGYFYAMKTRLQAQKARPPYYFVCHPYQWHVLAKSVSIAGASVAVAPAFQDEITRQWNIMQLGDVYIRVSPDISIDANTDAYCAMFSRQAIALDVRRGFRLEPERDASRRGVELNASMVYAYGVWRPSLGVQGIFDCAMPTS